MAADPFLAIAMAALSIAALKHSRHRLRLWRKRRMIERAGGHILPAYVHEDPLNTDPVLGAHTILAEHPNADELPPGYVWLHLAPMTARADTLARSLAPNHSARAVSNFSSNVHGSASSCRPVGRRGNT